MSETEIPKPRSTFKTFLTAIGLLAGMNIGGIFIFEAFVRFAGRSLFDWALFLGGLGALIGFIIAPIIFSVSGMRLGVVCGIATEIMTAVWSKAAFAPPYSYLAFNPFFPFTVAGVGIIIACLVPALYRAFMTRVPKERISGDKGDNEQSDSFDARQWPPPPQR